MRDCDCELINAIDSGRRIFTQIHSIKNLESWFKPIKNESFFFEIPRKPLQMYN